MAENQTDELHRIDRLVHHIEAVRQNCIRMGEKLIEDGDLELGLRLIANGMIHDHSKLSGIEWKHLWSDNPDKEAFKLAWEQHVSGNPHHPEYWTNGISEMPEIYLAEMAADWRVRSSEFATSLVEWIDEEATKRYKFAKGDKTYEKIMRFVKMMCDEPFRKVA